MMPISTTAGGAGVHCTHMAGISPGNNTPQKNISADHHKIACFMTGWEFRHWNVMANGNQSKLQGNEGGGGGGEEDPFDLGENWSQTLEIRCLNIWATAKERERERERERGRESERERQTDNMRRRLRKWIWHDFDFIAYRVKKG